MLSWWKERETEQKIGETFFVAKEMEIYPDVVYIFSQEKSHQSRYLGHLVF